MNVISISLFSWVITNNQIELITENTRYQAKEQISNVVRDLARIPKDSSSRQGVAKAFQKLALPYILFRGDSVLQSSAPAVKLPSNHARDALAAISMREDSGVDYYLVLDKKLEMMLFYVPYEDGVVFTQMSMGQIGRRFKDLYQLLGVTIISLTLMHLAFGFLIFRLVITPILKLHQATGRIAQGEYGHRVDINRHDEIGALADGFNFMTGVIQQNFQRIEQMAVTDELTNLYNRRYFFRQLEQWLERSDRYGNFLGLILLDIDFFKKCNDNFGHVAGDQVLRGVAKCLADCARKSDIVARYGGEEMVILLPETTLDGVVTAAEKMRRSLEELEIRTDTGKSLRVTASFGAVEYQRFCAHSGGNHSSVMEFVEAVDAALYLAKENGRNRVEVSARC
jgi:diguanylate cyclase (GGDEF)-like protein